MSVEVPGGYVQAGKSAAVWHSVAAAVREIPGVKSVSLANFTPLSGRDRRGPVAVRGYEPASTGDSVIHIDHVSEGYSRQRREHWKRQAEELERQRNQ